MFDFKAKDVEMPLLDYPFVESWIEAVAREHNRRVGDISYIFCSDKYMLDANNRFLGHDYYTDIITFDFSGRGKVSAEILISLDTVESNAEKFHQAYIRELLRVIIHGVLHLCGINDKGPGEREIMEAHEDAALSLYEQMDKLRNTL